MCHFISFDSCHEWPNELNNGQQLIKTSGRINAKKKHVKYFSHSLTRMCVSWVKIIIIIHFHRVFSFFLRFNSHLHRSLHPFNMNISFFHKILIAFASAIRSGALNFWLLDINGGESGYFFFSLLATVSVHFIRRFFSFSISVVPFSTVNFSHKHFFRVLTFFSLLFAFGFFVCVSLFFH